NAHKVTDLAIALARRQPEGSEVNWGDLVNKIINPLPGTPAHHWIEAWAGYKARENGARAEMRANLIRTLRQQRHRVKIVETAHDPYVTELKKTVKDRIQLREADELASEDAAGVTLDIAYKILSSSNATEKKRRKAHKAILQDKLPGVELGVTFLLEAVIKDQGKLLKQTTQLWDVQNLPAVKAIEQKSWLKRIDIRPFIYHPSLKHRALKAEVLNRLGLLEFIEASEPLDFLEGSKDPRLRGFLDRCLWNKHDIRRVLGINITQKTTAIQALGRFLKKLGYELKSRKVGPRGQQVRLWSIHHRAPEVQATILTALSLKAAEIAPAVSTTFYINNKQAGLDTNEIPWIVGLKARDKLSGMVGTVTDLEPGLAVFQLEDGTEWPWLLEQLEVIEAAAA
ncbi:MAG: hypothetical protein ACR2FS_07715, partial [Phormidesmis sp.]